MTTRNLFILFALVFAVQMAHYFEHVAQLIQIYTLGFRPAEAHGLFGSVFDFEWVHFLYNLGLEIALVGLWLVYRIVGRPVVPSTIQLGNGLIASLVVFQGFHSIEHIAKLFQYLFIPFYASGQQPTPGILPHISGWQIFLVHFWLNTIVCAAMALAFWFLRPNAVAPTASPAENR